MYRMLLSHLLFENKKNEQISAALFSCFIVCVSFANETTSLSWKKTKDAEGRRNVT